MRLDDLRISFYTQLVVINLKELLLEQLIDTLCL